MGLSDRWGQDKFSMFKNLNRQKGFSFTEILTVIGIVSILFGFIVINLLDFQSKRSVGSEMDLIISDIKAQQAKAMLSKLENGLTGDYGIYFEQNKYTLFQSSSYQPSNPTNFQISLNQNLQFQNVLFPTSQIIFLKGSGEISNFIDNQNSLIIKDTANNNQKTIIFNRYGVITGIN